MYPKTPRHPKVIPGEGKDMLKKAATSIFNDKKKEESLGSNIAK